MFTKGIEITWSSGTEYIQIDLEKLSTEISISTTYEWWPSVGQLVQYNTTSHITKQEDGAYVLNISYQHSNNQHLKKDDICWGVSTIVIVPNADGGSVSWVDTYSNEFNCTTTWTKLGGLLRQKKRVTTTKAQREQAQFRAVLLSKDVCCAISGEATPKALEAAHIIPSKDGGAEVIENGILLRADLHKLFDDDQFYIMQDGRVVIAGKLSEDYKKLLNGKNCHRVCCVEFQAR